MAKSKTRGEMKAEETEERISRMVNLVMSSLAEMDNAEYRMTQDMLETYCWISVHLKDLTDKVNTEGMLLYNEQGIPKENPAVPTIAKLAAKKSDYYTKIFRVLSQNAREAISSLDAFLEADNDKA